ncbi:Hypothetical predicted protein [Mytilus galloprovincialis]|uniref:SMB domain-containing protein n=2 Tax=Mytilus galloprovincialis TaxID=29158 RepID=A0A8B6EXL1_MYTGA|nr:Hypothetical predicted protein [Mytilus galloprovincialis]
MAFLLLLLFILEVHSLNISHVIEVYTNICGSKLCGRSIHATQSDIIKRFNISECPPCYCDKQCFSRENCCPDFYFSYPLKCTNINIVEKSPYKNSTSVLMVDTCPSFADNKTMYICEKKNDELIDKIQNSPVTSTRNNLIYRNIYCALCHNETKENLINWKLEIQCTDFADFNFLSSYEEILNTVNAKRCNIGFHTDIPTRDLPICNSVDEIRVQKCNITGTWKKYDSDIQKACETYNQKSFLFFKNIFCVICNPPRNQDNIISQCNITGLWRHNDSNLEQACKMGMSSTIVLPFRNIYCYICNNGIVNHVNNDLVNFAMRNKCQLSSRPPKPVNPARRKGVEIMFNKSNVTRRWHRIDPDIKYVCENMNTSTFSTIFCLIWHPNRHNETLISSCNMTLKSSMYDFNTIEHLCLTLPAIANVAPYKNELCRQYNEYSYFFSRSHIITTHRPPPNGLPSFRVLFTLQLTSYENKLDSSNESSCDDVFIQETVRTLNFISIYSKS